MDLKALRPLLGKPCWNVRPGWGSYLTLEFGRPRLKMRDPIQSKSRSARVRKLSARRSVIIKGQWHLWIYDCHWTVSAKGRRVGDSRAPRSYRRAAEELDGQKLAGIAIDPRSARTVFEFDLGAMLETRPCDRDGEQWRLKEPSGHWFVIQAGGRYSYANRRHRLSSPRASSPKITKLLVIRD